MRAAVSVLALVAFAGAIVASRGVGHEKPGELAVVRIASGLEFPVQVGALPGERDRLYVAEQIGRVRLLDVSGRPAGTLLDVRSLTRHRGEQGLLGLALHPGYERNGRLYVHYTDRRGDTRVAEYRTTAGRTKRVRQLLFVDQPYVNHNGGQLTFGPDGLLYLGLGDGGSAYDPGDRAQDLSSPLGKLLRIDVDAARPRWATVGYGLRNPWRFSFDAATGDLYVGDVGQDRWEEVNFVERGQPGLLNFGWDAYEGRVRVGRKRLLGSGELVWPIAVYGHDPECSVTGGFVYRGSAIPWLRGRYIYGDYCTGTIWTLRVVDGEAVDVREERIRVPGLRSFGVGADGELYVVAQAGAVYRVEPHASVT